MPWLSSTCTCYREELSVFLGRQRGAQAEAGGLEPSWLRCRFYFCKVSKSRLGSGEGAGPVGSAESAERSL